MKKPKARFVLLIVATLALAATAFAQPGDVDRHKRFQALTMENFRSSLTSDIQGVVEWTILDVVVYKKYYPDLDYDRIIPRLNHLAEASKVPMVSYKAYLASMYLSHGDKIALEVPSGIENEENVFKQIAEQLEKNLLSANLSGNTASAR
jgi:methyltransferase-like protein